ncbi:hypothetical protein DRP04_01835 [Archaeoglobales archaeon]|nr:MAG: hypothetical protein DRP04_01835 [Archaeoglobales archaeon]
MKTRVDGYFYVPTLGPFLGGETGPPRSLKVELLFDDEGLEGDQTGGESPYPELAHWPDSKVDVRDANFISSVYGTSEGDTDWDYMGDINADKKVDVKDQYIVQGNYGNVGTYITDLSGVTIEFDSGEVYEPDPDGFVNIPEGATSFYVKKNGAAIGALITFWKEPLVTYTLTINVDKESGYVGDTFTFYGTLTENGNPVSGATVTLYKDDSSTDLTDVTGDDGSYSIQWVADQIGSHDFYTEAVW